ncbi:T9SS type A sorting domain-containing protein [Odoribacter sp. OttesenSCG-928-L07]|nr:T9SS type A sorting domain-containing protein [Odoribacter sp. OttesenSCG-928-L07]MDL2238981.1 T9SS type A sorting domain-containing protein [Bacteroidales bacterium OttesenSCG-928-L14]MDL2240866.1 T9SS type A sorting domain-containing protein [Bacteroidales bacterium OttesenSCG-928-K22]
MPIFKHPKDQLPTFAGQLSLQYGTYHYYKRNYSMSLTGPDLVTSSATYTASYTNATFNRISWKVEPTELFQDSSGYGLIANLQLKTNPTYLADSATITFKLGHQGGDNNYHVSKRFAVQIPTCTISGSDVKSEGFTVKPDATVTITGTIKNYEKAIIKVPVSATLVVNGGKLTNGTTNKMWQGIRVIGNKNLAQTPQNQGTVILQNGATIENAVIAIATYDANSNVSSSGGIIQAEDATFKNNANAVTFWEYPASPSGRISNNQSYFTRCNFIVDDNNLFSANNTSFDNHVSLWKVYGIKFKGCNFTNNMSKTTDKRQAIFSEGAYFSVDEYCPLTINNSGKCYCVEQISESTFTGFSNAIQASTDGTTFTFSVNRSDFNKNKTAVLSNGVNNFKTTLSNVKLDNNPFSSPIGIRINASTGYKVEGNTLYSNSSNSITNCGVYVYDGNSDDNLIYLNTFNNLNSAISVGSETTGMVSFPITGLQFQCNSFSGNAYDISISMGARVRGSQGNATKGADNDFSSNATFNIRNSAYGTLNYYYSTGGNHAPASVSSRVTKHPNAVANQCKSTICNNDVIIVDKSGKANDKEEIFAYTQLDQKYSSLLDVFYSKGYDKVLTDNENGITVDEKLLQAAMQMHEELLEISWQMAEISNTALQTIKTDSIYDLNQLLDWYEVINNLSAKYSLAEVYYQMEDFEKAYSILTSIPKNFNLNENQYFEHLNYLSFFEFKRDLHKSGRTYFDMKEDEISKLLDITKANTGASSYMAQGVLCFFHDICLEMEEIQIKNSPAAETHFNAFHNYASNNEISNNDVYVYPNPGSNYVTVLTNAGGQLELVNTSGQSMLKCNVVKGSNSIDVSFLPKGVYVYRVTSKNSVSATGKWVKM